MKKRDKKDLRPIIGLIIFAIVGIIALITGYVLQDGWGAVLAWFTSRWAVYIYIALGIAGFLVIWFLHQKKMEG